MSEDRKPLSVPEQRTLKRKVKKLVSPARHEEVPTGEEREVVIWRQKVDEQGEPVVDKDNKAVKERVVERRPVTEKRFHEAVYAEQDEQYERWCVETIPLSPKKLKATPKEKWPEPEVHEFATEQAAHQFFSARQRQGFE